MLVMGGAVSMWGQGEYENTVLFAQFHYEPKTAPQIIKYNFKELELVHKHPFV